MLSNVRVEFKRSFEAFGFDDVVKMSHDSQTAVNSII